MLGKSENISHSVQLFSDFNKKYKIFTRKTNLSERILPELLPRYSQQNFTETDTPKTHKNHTRQTISAHPSALDNAIDAVLIAEFMPASVVINHQMEIVQFRGTTDLFLTHPKGKATFNILKMARPEIAFELRNAISKVIKTNQSFRKSGIEMKIKSVVKVISLEIVPLKIASDEPLLLVLFSEQEQIDNFWDHEVNEKNNSHAKDRRIKKLEMELEAAHADALAIAMEQEAFSEELQCANEEVVSSNEELQTVNEELETSKEEIESTNEELISTNQELQTRNDLLNEAYDYSKAVFTTIHEPMIVLDKNLRVKSANETFYKLFKVKEEDTEEVLLYDLGNKQWNIPGLKVLLEDILPKNTHFHDFEITHSFPLIGTKTMLLNARRIIQKTYREELILLAISDITEKKLFEDELIEAKEAAENAAKSKQQFLSNMSHEIRTPSNSILGFTNVLLKTKLDPQQKEYLDAIQTSGKTLNILINDILDLAKVDAGKMAFEKKPFEIYKSIRLILHTFDPKIEEKKLKFVMEYDKSIPSVLLGDSVRLNQIILNLMSNAIKFTHEGTILLSIKLLNEDEENVTCEFTVTDTGIGIGAKSLDSIFNAFEQDGSNAINSYGGTGLGLSIVKQLIEAQGGSISVTSKKGKGSAFSFTLSFEKTNTKLEEDTEVLKLDSELKGLRVLVAEDVKLNQLLVKIILTDFGFEYDIVENGKIAIEKLQTNNYDIILMDLQMPVMNGFEATEYIRKTMKSDIPIIALTAAVTPIDVARCKALGVNDYVSKPMDEKLLYKAILDLVKKRH